MKQVRLRSLAKINLDLRVLRKRPDGFHELRTVFQTISLADTIDVACERGRTRMDINSNLEIPDNIIVRAAESVLQATRTTASLRFRLHKQIPTGAGLGGGSSNAAAILLALPVLLGRHLPLEKLLELAGTLGSDVPFFLLGGTAVGIGRGSEVYPAPDFPNHPALLITPGVHVSTKEAYAALSGKLTTTSQSCIINEFQGFVWRAGDRVQGRSRGFVNDFETVVFGQHRELKSSKGKLLKLGAQPALMSGSGSSLFGIFANKKLRDEAAASIQKAIGNENVHSVSMTSRRSYRALWWRQLAGYIDSKTWPPQSQHAAG